MSTTKPTDNSDGIIDSVPDAFPIAGSWQLDWYNANDSALFQSDRVRFDENGLSVGLVTANTYGNRQGWIPYARKAVWRAYHQNGQLKIVNHYGMAFYFQADHFEDDNFNGTGIVSGVWTQILRREPEDS